MPIYEYQCEECGDFPELRAIEERNHPAACPSCGAAAARIISAPFLAVMNPVQRMAASRNERSRHEPKIAAGRACCATGSCSYGKKKTKREGEKPALQASTKKYRRPWMLGH